MRKLPQLALLLLLNGWSLFLYSFQSDLTSPKLGTKSQLEIDTIEATLLVEEASLLFDSTRYDSALVYYEHAMALYKPHLVDEADRQLWTNYIFWTSQVAMCQSYLKNIEEALVLLERGVKKGKEVLGVLDPLVADLYNDIGIVYFDVNQFDKAREPFQHSLNILKEIEGSSSAKTAKTYKNISLTYLYTGRPVAALENVNEALKFQPTSNKKDSLTMAELWYIKGYTYLDEGSYQSSLDSYLQCLEIQENIYGENAPQLASIIGDIGGIYIELNNFDLAINYLKKAIPLSENDKYKIARFYFKLAIIYRNLGRYEQAIAYFKKAADEDNKLLGGAYNGIGLVYGHMGQHHKELEYFQKVKNIWMDTKGEKSKDMAGLYNNMGMVYKSMENYAESMKNHKNALAIRLSILEEDHPEIATSYSKIGALHNIQGDYGKALENLEEAKRIRLKRYGMDHTLVADSYSQLGKLYTNLEDIEKAYSNYQKSLAIDLKIFGEKHTYIIGTLMAIGAAFGKVNKLDSALHYYQQALIANSSSFASEELMDNPSSTDSILTERKLVTTLREKAILLYNRYNITKESKDLETAQHTFMTTLRWIDKFRQKMGRSEDKYTILKDAIITYEYAIKTSHQLYVFTKQEHYLEEAFRAQEKSRSVLLLENLQQMDAIAYAGISDSLLSTIHANQTSLSFYEKEYFKESLKKEKADSVTLADWKNRIFDLKQNKDSLIQVLETQYPGYFQLKYDYSVASIKEIQNNLPNKEIALLEYFVGDSTIYAFLITKDQYQLFDLPKDFPLADWIKQLRTSIYTPHLLDNRSEASIKTYADSLVLTAHQLYQQLIAPIAAKITLPEQLIIVPDGILSYLPFEVLIKERPIDNTAFATHAYLLKDHQISYNYSATLWQEMRQKKHKQPPHNLLAFAPSFENNQPIASRTITEVRAGLGALTHNIPEVEAIQQQIGGAIFTGYQATKNTFLQQAPNYKILHLSTHGKANDRVGDYAYLAFAPTADTTDHDLLYNKELYNIRLNADMVVLSACETGIGELQKGEGIISLARGFSYAGAKSIITTLWSVNDAKTKELMAYFYKHLKANQSKDAALRQAKLDLIAKHSHVAHPFFWAGFIGIGDMEQLALNNQYNWWLYGIGGLAGLSLLVGIFFRKNRKK